jgi:hypothetical protein
VHSHAAKQLAKGLEKTKKSNSGFHAALVLQSFRKPGRERKNKRIACFKLVILPLLFSQKVRMHYTVRVAF